jgi:hypothetical protein
MSQPMIYLFNPVIFSPVTPLKKGSNGEKMNEKRKPWTPKKENLKNRNSDGKKVFQRSNAPTKLKKRLGIIYINY